MMFPVQIQQVDGRYHAVLLAAPSVAGTGATTHEAVMALRAEIDKRVARGEIVWINIPQPGEPAGRRPLTAEEAAAWDEVVNEIYRERDAQKAAEFPG